MIRHVSTMVMAVTGLAAFVFADVTMPAQAPSAVPAQTPAVAPATAVTEPAASNPAPAPATAAPADANTQAAVPAEQAPQQNQDIAGTVQSVDRRNRSLVLQNTDGKDIAITLNPDWHVYRRGNLIQYQDVEPNDHVLLLYRAAS